MDEFMKDWIDNASYFDLLKRWRGAGIGSPWFQGDIGQYYKKVMTEKQNATPDNERIAASKKIGWTP